MRDRSGTPLKTLFERRLDRRKLLRGGVETAAAATLVAQAGWLDRALAGAPTFTRIEPSKRDAVLVPEGYDAKVVLRWGDPLFHGAAALDPLVVARGALLEPAAAVAQERQFGYNCDGLGSFALGNDRWLLCVNHEFPVPALLFPGWVEARDSRALGAFVHERPATVAFMQAAVGLSVVELKRRGSWRYVRDSRFNRRVTATTPIEIAGPARRHPLLNPRGEERPVVLGTFGNCAAGVTPWRTYLTAEENIDDYFGNGAARFGADDDDAARALSGTDRDLLRVHARFGFRRRDSAFRWEYADARFDMKQNPAESLKFGWIVELDPFDVGSRPKKRTALGRFKHECATTTLTRDGRAAVYMGDDQQFEYLYKFVTRERFDAERPEANRDLLDSGTLHVARFDDDGRGRWLPLVHGETPELGGDSGFLDQADVLLRCREAADRVGATPLDRPEDVAVHPRSGNVYVSCTQNLARGSNATMQGGRTVDTQTTASSPRGPNSAGHILEIVEDGGDAAATSFRWEIFVLAGAPTGEGLLAALPAEHSTSVATDATYFAGADDVSELSAFANPDNLGFDPDGNLWIVTDGTQPDDNNDGCFVCPTEGPERGRVRQFMSGPYGAEVCGCEFARDGRTLFLSIQHPGEGGSAVGPQSHWPDGGDAAPRPSVIAIEPRDARRPFGS